VGGELAHRSGDAEAERGDEHDREADEDRHRMVPVLAGDRPRDFAAVAAIAASLALLAWAAPEEGTPDTKAAAIAIGALALIAALPWLVRFALPDRAIGWAFIFAAGCGYAGSGLGTALITESSFAWAITTALVAGIALLGEPLTPAIGISFTLVLAGSLLATARNTRRSEPISVSMAPAHERPDQEEPTRPPAGVTEARLAELPEAGGTA
jgi:hypothetical protein